MNIGIIGPGKIGSGLGKIWAQKGHHITFCYSRDAEKLKRMAAIVPNAASSDIQEAVRKSEVILLSVVWEAVEEALKSAGSMDGKIVIDCTNPTKKDLSDLAVGHVTSAAEEIAKRIPGARVVKAFNTVFADVYHSDSRLFGTRKPTMFYCGDDNEAKQIVSKLIIDAGFESCDAGALKNARYLEPLAMLMIQLGYGQDMGTNIALNLINR
ncbi:MAG: NADPH-dependent F420 reductase [Nitrospiraceae bacterium]|jgi:predicted dinucleotide-binding enzyme|nr:MAG: NADPH-dependent F420 reductase [Nitrospiraceae bacterium]